MSYLVDTDWVIDFLQEQPGAVELFETLAQHGVGLSLMTFGEIYRGIYDGRDPQRHEDGFGQLLRTVEVIGLNEKIMLRYARLRGALRKNGQEIGVADVLIGATALHYDLALVTRNLRHYRRIADLQIHPPWR